MELHTLITAEYMKKYKLADYNIDTNRILPVIMDCQRAYIRPLLNGLYPILVEAVVNNNTTPAQEFILNEYISPCLANYTMMKLRPELTHQLTNKGSQVKSAEFSSASSDKSLQWLMDEDLKMAELYAQDLIKFLCENRSNYPDYTYSENPTRSGLYIGSSLNTTPYMYGRKGLWYGNR